MKTEEQIDNLCWLYLYGKGKGEHKMIKTIEKFDNILTRYQSGEYEELRHDVDEFNEKENLNFFDLVYQVAQDKEDYKEAFLIAAYYIALKQ